MTQSLVPNASVTAWHLIMILCWVSLNGVGLSLVSRDSGLAGNGVTDQDWPTAPGALQTASSCHYSVLNIV